jgi:hypothetical protein
MTPEEREVLENAVAQGRATQLVLAGLLDAMRRGLDPEEAVNFAFHLAGETATTLSMSTDKTLSTAGTRSLQAIDHLRDQVLKR